MYIFSQLFGLGAIIFLFAGYQQNIRIKFLMCKLSADVCWAGHYLLLSAYAGMIPNFVGIFREIIFISSEKHRWANNPLWLIVFLCINLILGAFNYNSLIDVFPIIASVFITISMWIKKLNITKILLSVACTLFLLYNYSIGSLIGVINETISIISIIIFFVRRKNNE